MLELAREAYDDLLDHVREDVPREACGLLAGSRNGTVATVETVHRARNAAVSPRIGYKIDPRAQLALMDGIEDAGRSVVGIYHSHPVGPPGPSTRDVEAAGWEGHHYVVVSLAGGWPTLTTWRLCEGSFEADTVRLV